LSIPVTLSVHWDHDGYVHYFLATEQMNVSLKSIHVPSFPNCENIIRKFYGGNAIANPFPVSTYVNYFQFGVVSSELITETPWVVRLSNPMMLKRGWMAALGEGKEEEKGWTGVDCAWTVQGNYAFLDADWKWGGRPYRGVNAEAQHSENQRGVVFSYTGQTLTPGVLWNDSSLLQGDVPYQLDVRLMEYRLVDTGIYSIVRHPQYVTFILWAIAGALLFQHWIVVMLGLPVVPLTYIDLIRADPNVIEKFGDDYKAYITRVLRVNFLLGLVRRCRKPEENCQRRETE
jgi:hypothetical protein